MTATFSFTEYPAAVLEELDVDWNHASISWRPLTANAPYRLGVLLAPFGAHLAGGIVMVAQEAGRQIVQIQEDTP